MAIKWCVVFVLALVIIQAKARDMPTKQEAISEDGLVANGDDNTNTVNVGPTDKSTVVPGGKGVKDKKCGMLFSGIGGWGGMSGFIPFLSTNAASGSTGAPGVKALP